MNMERNGRPVPKCPMGVAGLDDILDGCLPRKCTYWVQGDAGVGKTRLSETKEELEPVVESHGWNLEKINFFELSTIADRLHGETENTFFHPSEVELDRTTKPLLDEAGRVKPVRVVFGLLSEMRMLAETPLRHRRQILHE
jgi:circadian clock protein KaiC